MHIRKILSDAERRKKFLVIILLLVQHRVQNPDLTVSIMLQYGQKIGVDWQQVNINVYVRCFAIIVVQENILIFL